MSQLISVKQVKEIELCEIKLKGEITNSSNAEISELSWYKDNLIFLPQYPSIFKKNKINQLFYIKKAEILKYIYSFDENLEPISPYQINFIDNNLENIIKGFEGYEAIAFDRNIVYTLIESSEEGKMKGYLVKGTISEDFSKIVINTNKVAEINVPTNIANMAFEACFIKDGNVYVVFEGNGKNINKNPNAYIYNSTLDLIRTIKFPNIDYRITDFTSISKDNKVYGINYFYTGDRSSLNPVEDSSKTIERILEFEVLENEIKLTSKPPINLRLGDKPRNFEGIVKLEELGFLIVTDTYPTPKTVFGFIPLVDVNVRNNI